MTFEGAQSRPCDACVASPLFFGPKQAVRVTLSIPPTKKEIAHTTIRIVKFQYNSIAALANTWYSAGWSSLLLVRVSLGRVCRTNEVIKRDKLFLPLYSSYPSVILSIYYIEFFLALSWGFFDSLYVSVAQVTTKPSAQFRDQTLYSLYRHSDEHIKLNSWRTLTLRNTLFAYD